MKNISIANLAVNTRKAVFEFVPGFKVELCYLSKAKVEEIREKCKVMKEIEATGLPYEDIDTDKFKEEFSHNVITGWSGLTGEILANLLLIDEDQIDLEEEIDFSQENALYLVRNCNKFDSWIGGKISSLENFRKKK